MKKEALIKIGHCWLIKLKVMKTKIAQNRKNYSVKYSSCKKVRNILYLCICPTRDECMEKKRKNRLQSSWLQQAQAVSREQGRKTAQPNGPNRVKSGHSGASRNFIFQQTDVSRVTSMRPTSSKRCITPPFPPPPLPDWKV